MCRHACVHVCVCVEDGGGGGGWCVRVCMCVYEGMLVGMRKDRCGWVIKVGIFVSCTACIVHNLSISIHDCICTSRSNHF